jgi:adenylate cyclase
MAEQVRRKLATILAADVVGYSRLTGADEEGTLKTLKTYREIIDPLVARHEGRIFGTAGDSVLAEFGSAVEAVRCAIAIQEELKARNAELSENRRMLFRIGINVGDVMIDGDNLFGDGVNVAARLEAAAEPGGICISGSVFEQVRNKLTVGFEKIGPLKLKNIAQPVPAFRLVSSPVSMFADRTAFLARRLRMPTLAAVLVVIVVVAGGVAWWQPWAPLAEAHRLSIVVLPFDNLSSDPKQDYLADAITEDLITDLSRIRGAFVIARGTSFTYKGKAVNAKDVAQELNVRYVLEGSVQRAGDQVRVNAQLIDGKSGADIWSERFDRQFKDVFSLQNEITGRVASALRLQLLEAESNRLKQGPPASMEAWDYALRGWAELWTKPVSKESTQEAKRLLDKAIALDPKLAMAWTGMARVYFVSGIYPFGFGGRVESFKKALQAAETATALDPKSAAAQVELGMALRARRRYDEAANACQKAIDLNRNFEQGYSCLALVKQAIGDPKASLPLFEQSLRLAPHLPTDQRRYHFIAWGHLLDGQYEEALTYANKSSTVDPKFSGPYWVRSAVYGCQGKQKEAKAELAKLAQRDKFISTLEGMRRQYAHVKAMERIFGCLRRAGMPEK